MSNKLIVPVYYTMRKSFLIICINVSITITNRRQSNIIKYDYFLVRTRVKIGYKRHFYLVRLAPLIRRVWTFAHHFGPLWEEPATYFQ